ncbi:hypothetical protein [Winogradskya humida]|uniref:GGDEF domain-containing protein n=1 Tax=Winogradskya humida TaxID=113566 RepID=A0ABQ3ZYY7_9ACTN|nr:hypothetical protein [Actinoplanes humidus]GIE23850.1 hypothetical protein Ahu01nite_069520 [Actinoplanes humidus]
MVTPDELDEDGVTEVLEGIAGQRSMLELLDTTDVLLGSGAFVRAYGARLHSCLLRGHDLCVATNPILATAFAEGALRLAVAGHGKALRTLTLLTPDRVTDLDPDYAERLPRLVGAALDVWGLDRTIGQDLRATLTALRGVPEAADAAAYECGLDQLRQVTVARAGDPEPALAEARRTFAESEDGALYGAGLDAVLAFFHGDPAGVRSAREVVSDELGRQAGALRNSHVPRWRQPRIEAAYAWARLVAILERAAPPITEPAWLNAWDALDAVLDAYVLERAVLPVAGVVDPDGFPRLVRPAIETALSRRQTVLGQLRYAVIVAEASPEPPARTAELRMLRDRIDALATTTAPPAEPDRQVRDRLLTESPALVQELGSAVAAAVADRLNATTLRFMERSVDAAAAELVVDVERSLGAEEPAGGDLVYVVAAGLQESAGRTNPERMNLRADLYRILEDACRSARLDWDTIERLDRGDSVVLLVPSGGGSGILLAGPLIRDLEWELGNHARKYQERHRMRLRVAVALGLCHRDDQGWLGEPVDEAVRLMNDPATRAGLMADDTRALVYVASRTFHDVVVRQNYRQVERDAFVPLPGAEPAWVLIRGERHAG